MSNNSDKNAKKEVLKDIILKLHKGLTIEEAKERVEKEVGEISSTEIAEFEQALINEGLSTDEIKKFCNVHALLFQSALEKSTADETFPSHPVYLFRLENREIEKRIAALKEHTAKAREEEFLDLKSKIEELLKQLRCVDTHYERKEHLLFPFLEKKEFIGPSKVMWGKDDEIRDLLKKAFNDLESVTQIKDFDFYKERVLNPLIEEIQGMIFKEENILFPTALEKLDAKDWMEILKESDDIGYIFIEKPQETEALMKDLKETLLQDPIFEDNTVSFPTGGLNLKELLWLLNTLPVDITFVDKDDKVRYFSEGKERIFSRTRAVIGREVQNCHPPQSADVVEKILKSFKEGIKDIYDFWINLGGKFIYIRYFAVRDKEGKYLGTLEVTQDLTELKKLEGEKRLVDERD